MSRIVSRCLMFAVIFLQLLGAIVCLTVSRPRSHTIEQLERSFRESGLEIREEPQLEESSIIRSLGASSASPSGSPIDGAPGSSGPVDLLFAEGPPMSDDSSGDGSSNSGSATGLVFDTAADTATADSSTSGLLVDTSVIISGTITTSISLPPVISGTGISSSEIAPSSGGTKAQGGGDVTVILPSGSATPNSAFSTVMSIIPSVIASLFAVVLLG